MPRNSNLKKVEQISLNDFSDAAIKDIAKIMNATLANAFALYIKTKNFHWHLSGENFRDYHLLFDEQAEQIFDITDEIAERVRKIGGITLHSIGEIQKLQTISDNNEPFVTAPNMIIELLHDNKLFLQQLRTAHKITDKYEDFATTSLIEEWIDQTERRAWFLYQIVQA